MDDHKVPQFWSPEFDTQHGRGRLEPTGRVYGPPDSIGHLMGLLNRSVGRLVADAAVDKDRIAALERKLTRERAHVADMERKIAELMGENEGMQAVLTTPVLEPFAAAVVAEAKHQITRWGEAHDALHTPDDWLWRLAHLGTKAAMAQRNGDTDKAFHHTITAAALLANWHRHLVARRGASEVGPGKGCPVCSGIGQLSRASGPIECVACGGSGRRVDYARFYLARGWEPETPQPTGGR